MENINSKQIRVLVAEDEINNFNYIKELLEDEGALVFHAVNGLKAVEMCSDYPFPLIFMDLKMPVMNGFEATAHIRKILPDAIIIAHTAHSFKREECMKLGFDGYLVKPYNMDEFSLQFKELTSSIALGNTHKTIQ